MDKNLGMQHFIRFVIFGMVGISAMTIHLGVVWFMVNGLSMLPERANLLGFLVAFGVSFSGHYYITFRNSSETVVFAVLKFFAVAVVGFLINSLLYNWLLTFRVHYLLTLGGVLIFVALITFLLSKWWVFRAH
ncbi:MAG: GtrA family protein [Gammaproteobacteria bacterium]|nr:GtrA family protein [Gammaproteobacteria bacterium]